MRYVAIVSLNFCSIKIHRPPVGYMPCEASWPGWWDLGVWEVPYNNSVRIPHLGCERVPHDEFQWGLLIGSVVSKSLMTLCTCAERRDGILCMAFWNFCS
jgi:hypothetical protein